MKIIINIPEGFQAGPTSGDLEDQLIVKLMDSCGDNPCPRCGQQLRWSDYPVPHLRPTVARRVWVHAGCYQDATQEHLEHLEAQHG